jgi:hypothetical protein
MSGSGLSCADCSLDGGEAPPRWFIVVQSKGRSNRQLQEEGGVTGRVESVSIPVCVCVDVCIVCVYVCVHVYVCVDGYVRIYVYVYMHILYICILCICVFAGM